MKSKKGLEQEKTTKNFFKYRQIDSAARFALNYLATNTQRQRISTYIPNLDAVFCNKHPKDPISSIYKHGVQKLHLLVEDEARLVSIIELNVKNGLYDILVVVRGEDGRFAYRAQLMYNIRQITHFLSEDLDSDSKSEISPILLDGLATEATTGVQPPAYLVSDKTITNIMLTPEEVEVN